MSQVSKADFARSHGFSKAYVSKLLKEGIISETKNGRIEEEEANQVLSLRSSLNYGAHYKGDAKAIQEQLLTVRLENEIEKGKLLKLETAEKEQTLIPAEQVKETLFRKGRLAPLIDDTPCLRNKVKDPRSRDSGNTVQSKEFQGGQVVITGANSAVGLRSMGTKFRELVC